MDLGMVGADDGHPTLDELTLEGVPNIRLVVSDVLLDGKCFISLEKDGSTDFHHVVPLYLTQKYRDQMTSIIVKEINRVYRLFVQRNPEFLEKKGKVTVLGHSLGVSKKSLAIVWVTELTNHFCSLYWHLTFSARSLKLIIPKSTHCPCAIMKKALPTATKRHPPFYSR